MTSPHHFIIIHGWGGFPDEGWFPWAKTQLESLGCTVQIPAMPDPMNPTIASWVGYIRSLVPSPSEHVHLIGHSLGVQTALRFAEGLKGAETIGTIIGVAGFTSLYPNLKKDPVWDSDRVLGPWLAAPLDAGAVRFHSKRIVAFFSDNDTWVPHEENERVFRDRFGAETHILHDRRHFSGGDECKEILEMLPVITQIIKK